MDTIEVEIIKSKRRTKTVAARMVTPTLMQVYAPQYMASQDIDAYVVSFKKRFAHKQRKEMLNRTQYLPRRAEELNQQYFGGTLKITSISYVTNQQAQFGSCTYDDATIRIADSVADMPSWVQDYVVIHELAHLVEPCHNGRFHEIVNRYPLAERARGFLIAKGLEAQDTHDSAHAEAYGSRTSGDEAKAYSESTQTVL